MQTSTTILSAMRMTQLLPDPLHFMKCRTTKAPALLFILHHPDERDALKSLIEGLLLKHEAKRWAAQDGGSAQADSSASEVSSSSTGRSAS